MDRGAERGPEASPAQFPHISALQSSQKSTVTQLAVHDYRLLHQDHPAYSNGLTPSDYYLFWNLKSDNDGVCYPWWWMTQAFFIDAENRFCLMLCDVINYNDVISATDSLEFVKDVRFTDV